MSKFTVDHKVQHSSDKTFETIQKVLSAGEDLKKFDSKIECIFDSSSKSCQIKGSQFKADLKVVAVGEGSNIEVVVDLPFLLMPFKGKIAESLTKMFKKHLG